MPTNRNIFRSLPSQLDRRRRDIDRVNTMAGGTTRYSVFVAISDPGELTASVSFPIIFTEKPVFYWGAEMDAASNMADGNYPIITPVIKNWNFRVQPDTNIRWYTGATLLILTSGVENQALIIQAHFEGRALRNPVTM